MRKKGWRIYAEVLMRCSPLRLSGNKSSFSFLFFVLEYDRHKNPTRSSLWWFIWILNLDFVGGGFIAMVCISCWALRSYHGVYYIVERLMVSVTG